MLMMNADVSRAMNSSIARPTTRLRNKGQGTRLGYKAGVQG